MGPQDQDGAAAELNSAATRPEVQDVFQLARKATTAYGRDDLTKRVQELASRFDDPSARVVIAGDFKQGKSSLVNGLLRYAVCPVDDDLATSVPTGCSYGEITSAVVVRRNADGEIERVAVPFEQARAMAAAGPGVGDVAVVGVEVELPSPRLANGLVLVDCPGDGGLASMTRVTTLGQIASAAAMLFVSDATAELNATELKFLTVAAKVCPLVAVVLTKCDLVPAWREIEEHDRRRLDEAGLRSVEILPVSSYLWAYAVTGKDPELSQLSGFPALDEWVDTHVVRYADRLITRSVLVELLIVIDQLEQQFVAEQRSLSDPAEAARVGAELEETQVRLRRLREQASRWQMVLNDGVADLTGHIDHDLSDRLRRLGREADETLDTEDPIEIWETFEPWLYSRVADDVTENFAELRRRTANLTESVATLFQADVDAILPKLALPEPEVVLAGVDADASADLHRMSLSQRAFTALRGSYGGILMGGFMGAKAGAMAAAAGVALTGGLGLIVVPAASSLFALALGNKAVRDEAERQLMMRRHTAKAAHRRYCDEVRFVVSKQTRDQVRLIQRTLRDHFLAQAEEFERTAKASIEQAKASSSAAGESRTARIADVETELKRIRALAGRIAKVIQQVAPAPGAG